MLDKKTRRIGAWLLVLAWAGVIFWFSSLPGSDIPGGYGPIGHFGEYAILGGLLLVALEAPDRLLPAVAIASAYGITDEIHQLFVRGRCADPVDWLVDTAGATVGVVVVAWAWRRLRSRNVDGRP